MINEEDRSKLRAELYEYLKDYLDEYWATYAAGHLTSAANTGGLLGREDPERLAERIQMYHYKEVRAWPCWPEDKVKEITTIISKYYKVA